MSKKHPTGTVYLIHLAPPYAHARHYLGFVEGDDVQSRIDRHAGHGSRLCAVAVGAGASSSS